MSDFRNLTKEQQVYLMQLAQEKLPSTFSQRQIRAIVAEDCDIYERRGQQARREYLPCDAYDDEDGQLYEDDSDEEVYSLETS